MKQIRNRSGGEYVQGANLRPNATNTDYYQSKGDLEVRQNVLRLILLLYSLSHNQY